MTMHLLGLPWTHTTAAHVGCAYTQKVVKFCRMFPETILYSNEENEAPCEEHVPIFSSATRDALFGPHDPADPHTVATWNDDDSAWRAWNRVAAVEVAKRAEPGDLLLMTAPCHAAVWQHNPALVCVEWGIGYERTWAPRRIFESYAWMHHVYGLNRQGDGSDDDAVVPNFFDLNDFKVAKRGNVSDGLTFLGRMIDRKGVADAVQIARLSDRPLILAGPGAKVVGGVLVGDGLQPIQLDRNMEYVGPVNESERTELLAESHAILMPTRYIEPFGGVAVEAMLSGRPVITTDFGAFTETVIEGVTGFRCRSHEEAMRAVSPGANNWNAQECRTSAARRYSLQAVRPMFERVFGRYSGVPL